MKVIFRRSDALTAEHGAIDDLVLNPAGDVQITNCTLRDVTTTLPIAEMSSSSYQWYADSFEGADSDWIGPFSDIIIQGD